MGILWPYTLNSPFYVCDYQSKRLLLNRIEELSYEILKATNDQIRELVAINPFLTERAIEDISKNPFIRVHLDAKERFLERKLTLQDFREDKELRELVKSKIAEFYPEAFDEVHRPFLLELEGVNQALKELEGDNLR